MKKFFMDFIEDESGATAIEYALIALGIGVAIIAAVNLVGTELAATFDVISAKLVTARTK